MTDAAGEPAFQTADHPSVLAQAGHSAGHTVRGDTVLVRVSIDTTGRADLRALRVPSSVSDEDRVAIREYLESARFTSAVYRGCLVRQVVEIPIVL